MTSQTFSLDPGTSSRHLCLGINLHVGTGNGFGKEGIVQMGFICETGGWQGVSLGVG